MHLFAILHVYMIEEEQTDAKFASANTSSWMLTTLTRAAVRIT
jgi:hypothetical protein